MKKIFSKKDMENLIQEVQRYTMNIYCGLLSFSTVTFLFGLWLGSGKDIFLLLMILPFIVTLIFAYQKTKMERDAKEVVGE